MFKCASFVQNEFPEWEKESIELERIEAERLQAETRRAIEESNRIREQQRAAESASQARSVVFKTPVIDYTKIANPDVRAITAIQEALRNPYTGKGPYGF